jgi:phage tail-like protein
MKKLVLAAAIALGAGLAITPLTISRGAEFVVNPSRFDPYKQHKFRVKWDGKYVPGIVHARGLGQNTDVILQRPGNANGVVHKLPGATTCGPIVLERGRSHDLSFEQWAAKVWANANANGAPAADFRKDVYVELYNEAGQMVLAWKVYRAWPSHYEPVKELNSEIGAPALEAITLECEGFERDTAVAEPKEPSFQ